MNKLFLILGKKKLRTSFFLIFFLFISGLLEAFSISLIIPLINVVGNSNFDLYPDYLIKIINFLEIENYKTLVTYVFLSIFVVFLLRFVFFLSADFLKVNFAANIRKQIQLKLFSNYIRSDFSFFLKNRVSNLIKNLINESLIYSDKYIFAILNIITDGLNLLLLGILLLLFNPEVTLIIIILVSILGFFYYRYSSQKIKTLSKKRQEDEVKLFKFYNESFNNLKDISIYNLYDFIINKTQPVISSYNTNYKRLYRFQVAAKPLLEIILILFFLLFSFISIFFFNTDTSHIISTFALFGASAFRIIPSFSRLINYVQDLKFSKSSKEIVENDILNFKEINFQDQRKFFFNNKKNNFNSIKIENLNFSFENKNIFENLNFEIIKGKTIGIIGQSGSGKSTLLNIILGLLKPEKGNIFYNIDKKKHNVPHTNLFSYVPQDIYLLDDSILSNIVFGKDDKDIDYNKINKIIEQVELSNFVKDLDEGLLTNLGDKAKNISGGQAQRISLARALYYDSEVIILDEFTNQLDDETENKIFKIIENLKKLKTIIIVSHKKKFMSICDEIYEIESNKLKKYE